MTHTVYRLIAGDVYVFVVAPRIHDVQSMAAGSIHHRHCHLSICLSVCLLHATRHMFYWSATLSRHVTADCITARVNAHAPRSSHSTSGSRHRSGSSQCERNETDRNGEHLLLVLNVRVSVSRYRYADAWHTSIEHSTDSSRTHDIHTWQL